MGVAEHTVTKATVAGVYFLRLRAIALALRGPPVFRSFLEKPALIERRYSKKAANFAELAAGPY